MANRCGAAWRRVWRYALLDPRGLDSGTDGAAELAGWQRLDRVAAGKQPALPAAGGCAAAPPATRTGSSGQMPSSAREESNPTIGLRTGVVASEFRCGAPR